MQEGRVFIFADISAKRLNIGKEQLDKKEIIY